MQAIVKNHGGFIKVYSQPGRGTSFKVYLPALVEARPVERGEAPSPLPFGHNELILVVDDEAAVRDITKQTLETFGYKVLIAANGIDAVSIYSSMSDRISLVLTDVAMPLMDGRSTLRALRKIDPNIKIVVASGLGERERFGDQEEVQAYLTKPYHAESLERTLDEVLYPEGKSFTIGEAGVIEYVR